MHRTGLAMLRNLAFSLLLLFSNSALAEALDNSWSRLLSLAVVDGVVDYNQWHKNAEFEHLVSQIATSNGDKMTQSEYLAFLINAYNILSAKGILEGHSPNSLLGRYTYFKRDKYTVAGASISLHELEHKLIRPLGEPRIHFALVCASHSCPVLQSEAYTAAKLEQQLDNAARGFINDPQRNQFDTAAGKARLSKIFDWFEEDFGGNKRALQAYLANYSSDPNVSSALRNAEFKIDHLPYDWSLNGTFNQEKRRQGN